MNYQALIVDAINVTLNVIYTELLAENISLISERLPINEKKPIP